MRTHVRTPGRRPGNRPENLPNTGPAALKRLSKSVDNALSCAGSCAVDPKTQGDPKDHPLLPNLRKRLSEDRGFTLIELLVTILIISILAAIAIPMFLNHQKKGEDADAESNARNLVSKVELCYATNEDYTACDSLAKLGGARDLGLPWGTSPGQVSVVASAKTTYEVKAVSSAQSDG